MAFTDTAPLPTTPTVPLQISQDLLARAVAPPADSFAYTDESDKAAFQANLPNFFKDTFDQLQQYDDVKRQQQEAYQEQVQAQQNQAFEAPVTSSSPIGIDTTPRGMPKGGVTTSGTIEGAYERQLKAEFEAAKKAGTPKHGFFGNVAEKIGRAVEPVVKPVTGAINRGFEMLPEPVQGAISTGAHEYQAFIDATLSPAMKKLADYSNLVTQNTIDPIVNSLLPEQIASPVTDVIDLAGVMAPYVALFALSGGASTPASVANAARALQGVSIAAFDAAAISDAGKYWEAYKHEDLTTGQFLSGMGMATLQMAGPRGLQRYGLGERPGVPGTALEVRPRIEEPIIPGAERIAPEGVPAAASGARARTEDYVNQMNESAVEWQTQRKGNQVTVINPKTGDLVRFERDVVTGEWRPFSGKSAEGDVFDVTKGERVNRPPESEQPRGNATVIDAQGREVPVGQAVREVPLQEKPSAYRSISDQLASERGAVQAPVAEAYPPFEEAVTKYYHGTGTPEEAQAIIKNGFRPGEAIHLTTEPDLARQFALRKSANPSVVEVFVPHPEKLGGSKALRTTTAENAQPRRLLPPEEIQTSAEVQAQTEQRSRAPEQLPIGESLLERLDSEREAAKPATTLSPVEDLQAKLTYANSMLNTMAQRTPAELEHYSQVRDEAIQGLNELGVEPDTNLGTGMKEIAPDYKTSTDKLAGELYSTTQGQTIGQEFAEQALRKRAVEGDTQAEDIIRHFDVNKRTQILADHVKSMMSNEERNTFESETGVEISDKPIPLFEVGRTEPVQAKALASEMHDMIRGASLTDLNAMERSNLLSSSEQNLVAEEKLARLTNERLATPERLSAPAIVDTLKPAILSRREQLALGHADSIGKLNAYVRARGLDPADYTGAKSPYWVEKIGGGRVLDTDRIRTDLAPEPTIYDRPLGHEIGLDDSPPLGSCARI